MPGKCGRCGKNVFAAEERLGLNQSWHERCFTCANCNRTLDSFTLAENRELNEIYCKTCYRLKFATKGYGYGPNEPTLMALPSCSEIPESSIQNACMKEIKCCKHTNVSVSTIPPSRCVPRKVKPLCNRNASYPHPHPSINPSHCLQKDSWTNQCQSSVVETKSRNILETLNSSLHQTPQTPPCGDATRRSVVCKNERAGRSSCLECDCGPPAMPRYPMKAPECHRTPLTANTFKKEMFPTGGLSGKSSHCQKSVKQSSRTTKPCKRNAAKQMGGGEPCKRCRRPVYWAEMKLGHHGTYHQECFTCCCCRKPLESTTVCENQSEIFCKGCYRRLFGTHGYGYGIGAGTLQTS